MKMEPIRIYLKEESGFERRQEPVQLGIPIPKGELASPADVMLVGPENSSPICQKTPLSHWPDGSVRWLRLNFLAALSPHQSATFTLKQVDRHSDEIPSTLQAEIKGDDWHINTGKGRFRIPRKELRWFVSSPSGTESAHEVCLTDSDCIQCLSKPEMEWEVKEKGPICITLRTEGSWQTDTEETLARFDCSLRFYAENDTVELTVCIHNPKRARHPGGLWDLGDPGSIHFRELMVSVKNHDSQTTWLKAEPDHLPLAEKATEELYLYQDSSGGNQWQSRNHINAKGKLTTRFRGYRLQSGRKTLETGNRASPVIALESAYQTIQVSMQHFWQNFPSSLGVRNQELIVGLFPPDAADPYELQGGERKTQTAYFNYGENPNALLWTHFPLIPTLDAAQYERAQAFPWFKADPQKGFLDNLIGEGLNGPSNFFAKREVIDEYGWRNFGEVFADHETLYQGKDEPAHISHYNNQYDAIYGFARQFALTGDPRWFELMDDLARHVIDIDIYHTNEDRGEYNNGLFWHTDHYLDAHTATHRTFTRHNNSSSTPGQTGGGPAEEHCYTTGLLYHYFLTGNLASREAVLDLASWITTIHEGSGTFLEQLLRIKRYEVPKIRSMLSRSRPNSHIYPFNRGTGNYLNALLDANMLEPEAGWLKRAENVVYSTIHPQDRIAERQLLSIENSWSYLVLLAAISRFLLVKEESGNLDGAYQYAAASLRHYSRWMVANEQAFLSRPSDLEFPNDTWAAQDLRKAMIFFQAPLWDPEMSDQYTARAVEFLDYVNNTLKCSPERALARVQVILLQNYGPHQTRKPIAQKIFNASQLQHIALKKPYLTWPSLLRRIVGRLARGLIGFRLNRERHWLSTRLDRS